MPNQKQRIVFLGNNVRDEFGLASEFLEIKIIPTTIAGFNINLVSIRSEKRKHNVPK